MIYWRCQRILPIIYLFAQPAGHFAAATVPRSGSIGGDASETLGATILQRLFDNTLDTPNFRQLYADIICRCSQLAVALFQTAGRTCLTYHKMRAQRASSFRSAPPPSFAGHTAM